MTQQQPEPQNAFEAFFALLGAPIPKTEEVEETESQEEEERASAATIFDRFTF